MEYPKNNPSGKDPNYSTENTIAQIKTNHLPNTQTLPPILMDKTRPIASKRIGPRGSYGQNMSDPWTNPSYKEKKGNKTQGK